MTEQTKRVANNWNARNTHFLLGNVGYLGAAEIAMHIGTTPKVVRRKIKRMGLKLESKGLPPILKDVGYMPRGTVVRETARSTIVTIPCSTPGIKSITSVSARGSWSEED